MCMDWYKCRGKAFKKKVALTPSLPQAVNFQAENVHMHTCKRYIWWSCNKSTFSSVRFDRNPFLCLCEGGKKDPNDFTFDAFIDLYQSDSTASMALAVKGLKQGWPFIGFVVLEELAFMKSPPTSPKPPTPHPTPHINLHHLNKTLFWET